MTERWEYRYLVGRGSQGKLVDGDGIVHGPLTQELLNRLGRDGWEVVSHFACSQSQPSLVIRRRLVEPADDGPAAAT